MGEETNLRKCKMCKKVVKGRSDKIFCSIACKNEYHVKLRQVTAEAVKETDIILHRNRSILLEVLGKHGTKKTIDKMVLNNKHFHFNYITGYYVNSKDKTYHYVYDFAWMEFSNDKILVLRKS